MPEGDPRGRADGPKSLIAARIGPLMWVVGMEDDVASDLSVFHRVDDMESMGSRRWARLVPRLAAYPGVVQFRIKAEALREQEAESGPAVAAPVVPSVQVAAAAPEPVVQAAAGSGAPPVLLPGPPSPLAGGKVVGSSQAELRFSDIGDMFSFGG